MTHTCRAQPLEKTCHRMQHSAKKTNKSPIHPPAYEYALYKTKHKYYQKETSITTFTKCKTCMKTIETKTKKRMELKLSRETTAMRKEETIS